MRVCLSGLEVYEFNDRREFYLYLRSLCLRCPDSRNGLCLPDELAISHILTKKVSSQMEVWHISSRILNDAVYPKKIGDQESTLSPFPGGNLTRLIITYDDGPPLHIHGRRYLLPCKRSLLVLMCWSHEGLKILEISHQHPTCW